MSEIQVSPDDILGIIERHARHIHNYVANPPPDFSPENLARHIARMYAFAEQLKDIADRIRKDQAGTEDTAAKAN